MQHWRRNPKNKGENESRCQLTNTNLTCTDLGLKPGLLVDSRSLSARVTARQIGCQTIPKYKFDVRKNSLVNQKIRQRPVASEWPSGPALKPQSQHIRHCA